MIPSTPVRIAPSVLNADFANLARDIALVEQAGADVLHLDVMDGHFVPNISFGVPVVESIRRCTRLPLDTHLMIAEPAKYAPAFVAAGSQAITFHIEAVAHPIEMVKQIHALGARAGVALNPSTPAADVFDLLADVDIVLVMTVWPGFGGQRFMSECLAKIEQLARRMHAGQWLSVDGGINLETGRSAAAAGANTLIAGTFLYRSSDTAETLRQLRRAAEHAAIERVGIEA